MIFITKPEADLLIPASGLFYNGNQTPSVRKVSEVLCRKRGFLYIKICLIVTFCYNSAVTADFAVYTVAEPCFCIAFKFKCNVRERLCFVFKAVAANVLVVAACT